MKKGNGPVGSIGYRRYKKLCLVLLIATVLLSIVLYKISHKDAPAVLFALPFIYLTAALYSFIPIWIIHIRAEADQSDETERISIFPRQFMWRYALFYAVVGLVAGIPLYLLGVKHYIMPAHKLTYVAIVVAITLLGAWHGTRTGRRKLANKAL